MQASAVCISLEGSLEAGFPDSPDHRALECGADVTAAPGNVLHSSSLTSSQVASSRMKDNSFQRRKRKRGGENSL